MAELLTRDQVRELLREIVAEFPEGYVYERPLWGGAHACVYSTDGCPSCLIGHLLHRLGVTVAEYDQGVTIDRLVTRHNMLGMFTPDAVGYLTHVQRLQDRGTSWASCLIVADAAVAHQASGHSADVDPQATV